MTVPTLRDVAVLAEVSMSTASRVLNNKPGVSADKRGRVLDALHRLDYVSNLSAQTLRGSRSRTWALLIDDLSSVFFSELAESLTRIALTQDCTLLIVTTQKDYARERQIIADMRARQVDGLFVVAASGDATGHRARQLTPLPIVHLERFPPGAEVDVVTFDYHRAGLSQIDQLWEEGHRRIGFIGGNVAEDPGSRRLAAFRDGLRRHGAEPAPSLISTGHLTEASASHAIEALMAARAPTALVITVAPLLRAALRLAGEHGWSLTIASYESVDTPSLTPVRLLVAHGNLDELARTAAELLRSRSDQPDQPPRTVLLGTTTELHQPSQG